MYNQQIQMQSKPQPQLKHLRDLDLNALQKPKTLIILHYKQRRISVPLFKETYNLASLLYNHVSTLEQKILTNDPNWEKKANQQIVCFQIKKQPKIQPEKLGDGDLRSDILLSLLRIQGEPAVEQLTLRSDVTKIFKYLEIQPYYRYFDSEPSHYLSPQSVKAPYFSFQRILHTTLNSNLYLARRVNDGYFFSIKVFGHGSKASQCEAKIAQNMSEIDQKGSEGKSNLLVRSQQIVFIPHPQTQQEQQEQDMHSCRHISVIFPYFVRGTLQELFQEARYGRKRIESIDCFNYLKELMWGVHILHQKYNLIHRALVPSNILIDQNGQLKLASFAFCIPCYDYHGEYARYPPRSKYPKSGFSFQELISEENMDLGNFIAPEMVRGQFYNYLVDFYSVGMIFKQLFELSQAQQRGPVSQNNQKSMNEIIEKLTSPDLLNREYIVQEMLEGISKEEMYAEEASFASPYQNLTLHDIKIGRQLEAIGSKKYIESQENSNGIDHETVFNFFKKPLIPKSSKAVKGRKVSKDKLSAKNSREKSQKCFSKASESLHNTSQNKKRKVSDTKNKSFNSSKEDTSKNSRQKKKSQNSSHKEKTGQPSPQPRKAEKSKSQERKKIQLKQLGTKQFTNYEQQRKVPVVPKSPKLAPIGPRQKSPGIREYLLRKA